MLSVVAGGRSADPVELRRVSLLIPARNEERNIAWVLRRVPSSIDEVIVVDGRSTDRTIDVARFVRPDVRIVTEVGRGKGAAVRTGIAAATGDFIVMLDADGSMDPSEIDRYLDVLAAGADLVKGSRFLPGGGTTDMTMIRRLGNRVLLSLVNGLYRTCHTELCYGFMAFRTDRVRALGLSADGFEIETEIVARSSLAGLDIREVPSMETVRLNGESNLNAVPDGLRVLRTIIARRVGLGQRPALQALPDLRPSRASLAFRSPVESPMAVAMAVEAEDEVAVG